MNIYLNSFSCRSFCFLKESVLPTLSPLHHKILVIVGAVLSSLAALYAFCQYSCRTKIQIIGNDETDEPSSFSLRNIFKNQFAAKPSFQQTTDVEDQSPSSSPLLVNREDQRSGADLALILHQDVENKESTLSLKEKLEMAKKAGELLFKLNLSLTDVTDAQLQEISKACPNLKELNLSGCSKLTDACIADLPRNLEKLNLAGCDGLTDSCVIFLPDNLRDLNLSDIGLTDACIPDLPGALRELNLKGNQITDAAIQHLRGHLNIEI